MDYLLYFAASVHRDWDALLLAGGPQGSPAPRNAMQHLNIPVFNDYVLGSIVTCTTTKMLTLLSILCQDGIINNIYL